MKFRARKSFKIGTRRIHVRINVTQSGFSSWGLRVGPWSWNARTRKHKINTPGLGYVELGGRRPAPRNRPKSGGAK